MPGRELAGASRDFRFFVIEALNGSRHSNGSRLIFRATYFRGEKLSCGSIFAGVEKVMVFALSMHENFYVQGIGTVPNTPGAPPGAPLFPLFASRDVMGFTGTSRNPGIS